MKSSFDKKLSAKFEDISPEDIGVRPDREKIWQGIEKKQQKKTISLRLWVSHAAAIAIGLLAGIYLLKDRNDMVYTAMKKTPSAIQTHAPTDTAKSNDATIAKSSIEKAKVQPYPTLNRNPIQKATTKEPVITEQEDIIPIPKPEEQIPDNIAAVKPVQYKKVLHLADMANENNHLVERNRYKPETFWTSITPNRFSAYDNYETISSMIVNRIK